MNNERLIIFIDGSNLFHGLRYLNIRIDYGKLIDFLKENRHLVRTYFYTAVPQEKACPNWYKGEDRKVEENSQG